MSFLRFRFFIIIFVVVFGQASPLRFAWEYLKHPGQVGAVFECSQAVAHELMRYAKEVKEPKKILEIGAGMGAVSKVICYRYLKPGDRLDVVEVNPEYCVHLRRKLMRKEFPNVHVHCTDVLQFKTEIKYDFIICTLPFNSFPNGLVKQLHDQLKKFAKPDAHFSYVEYMVLSSLRRSFAQNIAEYNQLVEHKKLVDQFKNQYMLKTVSIFKNVPPIYIHHLKIT